MTGLSNRPQATAAAKRTCQRHVTTASESPGRMQESMPRPGRSSVFKPESSAWSVVIMTIGCGVAMSGELLGYKLIGLRHAIDSLELEFAQTAAVRPHPKERGARAS